MGKSRSPQRSYRRHFEVCNALTGEVIDLRPCSTRIYGNTTLEWILLDVAAKLSWPVSHVRLSVGQTVVAYVHRLRDRTETFMDNLDPTAEVLTIYATKMPRPECFEEDLGQCLCDFGGCCVVGAPGICKHATYDRVTARWCTQGGGAMCRSCGNSGCCRCGNCGHLCCESKVCDKESSRSRPRRKRGS